MREKLHEPFDNSEKTLIPADAVRCAGAMFDFLVMLEIPVVSMDKSLGVATVRLPT